jgi:hypothetical protein
MLKSLRLYLDGQVIAETSVILTTDEWLFLKPTQKLIDAVGGIVIDSI